MTVPPSPLKKAVDMEGNVVRLGDVDCMGYKVGYIDEDGTCWESCREHDLSVTAGRFHDLWIEWNRSGGIIGPEDAYRIAREQCHDPDNIKDAAKGALEIADPDDPFNRVIRMIQLQRSSMPS